VGVRGSFRVRTLSADGDRSSGSVRAQTETTTSSQRYDSARTTRSSGKWCHVTKARLLRWSQCGRTPITASFSSNVRNLIRRTSGGAPRCQSSGPTGGLTPCRSHRFLSGVPWPTPDAPKGCRRSAPHSGQVIPWRSRTMPAPFCLIDRPHRPVDMLGACHCRRTWPLFVRAGVDPTSCDSQCDEPSGQTPITFWRKRSTARSATISTVILWATIAFHRAFRARPLPC
jgi:hypothetical protein